MKKITTFVVGIALTLGATAQVISTFPHNTDFESEALCGTSCTGACNLTGGWKNADQYGFPQAGTDWLAENGSTPSTNTGPDVDHTFGTAVAKYAYVETSGCTNVQAHLVSAIYDFSSAPTPRISFWWHMFGASMGTMHLDVDTTGLGNWVLDVIPQWTANVNLWQNTDVSLAAYAGMDSVRIRIRMNTGTSFTSDAGVDDISVYQPLSDDLSVISVVAGGGCGNSSCTPALAQLYNAGTNTIVAGTQVPVVLYSNAGTYYDTILLATNLNPGDTIYFTFSPGCVDLSGPSAVTYSAVVNYGPDPGPGNDSLSNQSMGIPVITNYPYYEDFEAGQNGWIINNGAAGTWAFGTPAKNTIIGAASGSNAFVTGGLGITPHNNNDNSYIEGPCFDFTNVCDPTISLNVWWNAEFSWDGMNIVTSIDGGATWQLVGAFGDQTTWYTDNTVVGNPGGFQSAWSGRTSTGNGSNGWVNARHHLSGCGNQPNVKIRIYFGSDGSVVDDGCAFDDVRIFNGAYLGADRTICSPATTILNADGGYPASVTYAWSTGATTSSITASTTGWYWVDVTNGSCVTRDSVYILSMDSNSAVALGADTTMCSGSLALNAGYWPGSSYLWSDSTTAQTLTASTTGSYTVRVITPCDTLFDTVNVVISTYPVVDLGADSSYCVSTTLIAGSGSDDYSWNTGDTTATLMVTATGTYYVDVTNVAGCMSSDTINVGINANPTVALGADVTQCGGTVMLDAQNPGAMYMWNDSSTAQMLTASASGSYYVSVTDSNGCQSSDTVNVTINAIPVVNLGADTTQCGGSVTLDAMNPGAGYLWNDSTTAQTLVAGSAGTYYVTVTDSNGCSASDSVNVMINANPTVNLGVDTAQCGGTVTLDAQNAGSMYMWSDSSAAQTLTVAVSGSYYVNVTDANGCSGSDTVMVTINTLPTVTGNASSSSVCVDDADVTLTGSPVGGMWTGPGVTGNNFDPSIGAGAQVLTYSYTDSAGCSGTAVTTINVSACVGINEAVEGSQLSVYPNPTFGTVTVATSIPTEIVIFNAIGEVVYAQSVQNTVTLDLSSFEGGVYIIRTSEGQIVRLVKE